MPKDVICSFSELTASIPSFAILDLVEGIT